MKGSVLITGGSGSLGTALIERAHVEGWDAEFTVYSRDEVKQSILAERFPHVRFVLGDVQDERTLTRAMRGIDLVVHAAAYKRVPEAERETSACVQTNVTGSLAVAACALATGVPKVVAISTDKACHPINAYGQSKALMERLWQSFARMPSDTSWHLVRYGNVLASRGSVVPALKAQAQAGRPITLTDPEMTRFWLTLDDAVDLVLAALDLPSGEVLVPACRSASMADLAEAIASEADVLVIGRRDGEKRHESLLNEHESPHAYDVAGGWALRSLAGAPLDRLPRGFAYTSEHAEQLTVPALRAVLEDMAEGRPARTLS